MEAIHHAPRDFDGFFAVEYPSIARAAWFVVLDTEVAKEIAQEAFCRALQRWDRISGYERPGAWVRTVAIRLALRSRDRRRRELVLTEVNASYADRAGRPGGHDGHDDLAVPALENADLEAALRTLPRQQRAAVTLRYLCDLDIDELAAAIGCKPSTARVHLHRGRHALGELLGAPDDAV
jgi:RNA polymerase sigma-70 factor (ECF subfamily)